MCTTYGNNSRSTAVIENSPPARDQRCALLLGVAGSSLAFGQKMAKDVWVGCDQQAGDYLRQHITYPSLSPIRVIIACPSPCRLSESVPPIRVSVAQPASSGPVVMHGDDGHGTRRRVPSHIADSRRLGPRHAHPYPYQYGHSHPRASASLQPCSPAVVTVPPQRRIHAHRSESAVTVTVTVTVTSRS